MVKFLLIFIYLLSIDIYASNNTKISNLRVDNRYILNDALIRSQRSKNNSYPIKKSEIKDTNIVNYLNSTNGSIIKYSDSLNLIELHGRIGGNTGIQADTLFLFSTYYDLNIRGNFHNLEFDLSARNNLDKYNKEVIIDWNRDRYEGPYYNTNTRDTAKYSDTKLWDENRFNVNYGFKGGSFEIGHGELSIGPSLFDNLFIGDSTHDFDYYMGDYSFGKFTFTFGMLGLVTDINQEQKNMAFHRLDFNNDFLNIGMYEGVVFKDRMPLMYLVPVVPFIFSEHYYGDVDNNNLGIDVSVFLKNFKIYTNLFIDDMYSLTSFFDDTWWGNKWGATLGTTYTKMIKKDYYMLISGEYTRVMPWVYTHNLDSGAIRYTHYGKELGATIGSDADRYNGLIEFGKVGKFSISTNVEKTRKGSIDTFRIHDDKIDGTTRKFLETVVEDRLEYTSEIKTHFNLFGIHFIPKLSIGGDREVFLKKYQFGLDIEY